MQSIRTVELFAGIGGLGYALRGLTESVALCERDPRRRDILAKRYPGVPLTDDVSTFECFPSGTLVLTDDGYTPIEDVTMDQQLMSHTGVFRQIVNRRVSSYAGFVYYIYSTLSSYPVQCTEGHPFYVKKGLEEEPEWVKAKDLTEYHFVGMPLENTYTECKSQGALANALEHQRYLAHIGHLHGMGKDECDTEAFIDGDGYAWFKITEIEWSKEPAHTVYNFEVDVDNSYVVHNMAVHNCTSMAPPDIDAVIGSWPCRGFAIIGNRNGYEHKESALFYEFSRIVRDLRPALCFQENVPGVTRDGLDVVRDQLASMYDLYWTTIPAYAVGSPQIRKRWFCLGIRRDIGDGEMTIHSDATFTPHTWTPENEPPRMVPVTEGTPSRLSMMGDSVVPDCVRLAFLSLFTGAKDIEPDLLNHGTYTLKRPMHTQKPFGTTSSSKRFGCFINGGANGYQLPIPTIPNTVDFKLVFDPSTYIASNPSRATQPILTEPLHLKVWATPRAQNLGACCYLTGRAYRDLHTQIRFEQQTNDRYGRTNPEWVEWLMGFPRGWTDASQNTEELNIDRSYGQGTE